MSLPGFYKNIERLVVMSSLCVNAGLIVSLVKMSTMGNAILKLEISCTAIQLLLTSAHCIEMFLRKSGYCFGLEVMDDMSTVLRFCLLSHIIAFLLVNLSCMSVARHSFNISSSQKRRKSLQFTNISKQNKKETKTSAQDIKPTSESKQCNKEGTRSPFMKTLFYSRKYSVSEKDGARKFEKQFTSKLRLSLSIPISWTLSVRLSTFLESIAGSGTLVKPFLLIAPTWINGLAHTVAILLTRDFVNSLNGDINKESRFLQLIPFFTLTILFLLVITMSVIPCNLARCEIKKYMKSIGSNKLNKKICKNISMYKRSYNHLKTSLLAAGLLITPWCTQTYLLLNISTLSPIPAETLCVKLLVFSLPLYWPMVKLVRHSEVRQVVFSLLTFNKVHPEST